MEEDDSTLLRYLIAEDQPNYELLFDDDEEMATMAAAIHVESCFKLSALLFLVMKSIVSQWICIHINYLCTW
jgi:hypothetical protein